MLNDRAAHAYLPKILHVSNRYRVGGSKFFMRGRGRQLKSNNEISKIPQK